MGISPILIELTAMDLCELKKGARTDLNPHEIFTGHTKKDDWPDEQMSMLDITNKNSESFHLQDSSSIKAREWFAPPLRTSECAIMISRKNLALISKMVAK